MKVKLIAIAIIILAGVIVLFIKAESFVSVNDEYDTYLASARANAENQVPYMAVQKYRQAMNIKSDDEGVYKEYLEQTRLLGDSFYDAALKSYVVRFPQSAEAYERLCSYYYDNEEYQNVINLANTAKDAGAATEKVRNYYIECIYKYKYVKMNLEGATTFLGNYAMVKSDGQYGYITDSGSYLIAPAFEDANVFISSSTAVNDGTEWYIINTDGFKIARPSEKVEKLSFSSDGKIRVAKNGKYGYTNAAFDIADTLPYDYATNFKNGVAAVKKGDKWALIDSGENMITDYVYEDILLDEYETCIDNGVIFAKTGGKYYMTDKTGSQISSQGFDNAYPFAGTEPAAVCIGGKWGFADANGNIVIEPAYTAAKSFSIGLAPVQENGKWVYINSNKDIRVNEQFDDALPFSSNGIAAVKENGVWNYIKLLCYY